MAKRDVISDVLAVVVVTCLLTLTGLVAYREFGSGAASANATGAERSSVPIDDWQRLAEIGHKWGNPNAPVVVVTFIDFQCPVCRRFALGAERAIRKKYADQLYFVVRHWPLTYHQLAFPAAKASECAASQGRFHEMYYSLFEKQDSLGIKSFRSYAIESGIPDLPAFERCMTSHEVEPRIAADVRAARRAGARGTPTVIVNGLRLVGAPDRAEFDRIVSEALRRAAAQ